MDRVKEVEAIIAQEIKKDQKIKKLKDILLDLKNEMEAEDQNMHPEIRHKVSEAYRIANGYLIKHREID